MEIFIDEIIKWFISVYESFYNSVIFENRYEMILDGLENTIILSFGALLIGITIGFLISIIRYTNNHTGKFKVLNFIGKTYVTIIRGTPSVLQLMIMYYVIFKTSSINSIIIGMLAFGINSGAYCSEILRSGFDSVDDGQLEAGLALGLTFSQTLKSIIIPDGVVRIGGSAFRNDYSLVSAIIPESVTRIGDYAFKDCYQLSSVYMLGNNIEFGNDTFARTYEGEIQNSELFIYLHKDNSNIRQYIKT